MDPSLDPELALALRVSLEEERARQEAAQSAAGGAPATSEEPATEGALWISPRHTPFPPPTLYCKLCSPKQFYSMVVRFLVRSFDAELGKSC